MDILDHIQQSYPDVYDRTRYNIIEISKSLADLQTQRLSSAHPRARVYNESIFRWAKKEPAPCAFIAMEVVVNMTLYLSRAIR
jgi:SAM-dependent MidA family methyltransferase